jgi:hypothetical protein
MNRRTAKLARWQIWLLSLSGGVLWLSGSLWLLLHHYGQVQGSFGPEANPLEPWMLRLHGFVLIPLLLGAGGLLVAHIPKGWAYHHQRVAGTALGVLLLTLIITGYMLYYVSTESLRNWSSIIHWILGLFVPLVFIRHYRGKVKS